jgi:hypothetical protein
MAAPVITPNPGTVRGDSVLQMTADQDVVWTCSAGFILLGQIFDPGEMVPGESVIAGNSPGGLYTPPNVTGVYQVTGTNAASQATTVNVTVTGVFPAFPDYGYEAETDKKLLVSIAVSQKRKFRVKSTKRRAFKGVFTGRKKSEYLTVDAFWDAHYKGLQFYYRDVTIDEEALCYIDSKLKFQPQGNNLIDYSLDLIQV